MNEIEERIIKVRALLEELQQEALADPNCFKSLTHTKIKKERKYPLKAKITEKLQEKGIPRPTIISTDWKTAIALLGATGIKEEDLYKTYPAEIVKIPHYKLKKVA